MNFVYGIDIAKASFEVFHLSKDGQVTRWNLGNEPEGFQQLINRLPAPACCVMEASGPYYLRLASALYEAGFTVVVLNPLVIRRFAQMQLARTKTDLEDARLIAHYGRLHYAELQPWEPPRAIFAQLRQLNTALNQLHKQLRMTQNQQHAFALETLQDPIVSLHQQSLVEQLKAAIKAIEKQIHSLCQQQFDQTYKSLISIPGIGPKTAALLIAITHDFTRFESAKQLVAYIGLCPRIFRSGSSINGREAIVKMGQPVPRACLYMAAFSAMKANPHCQSFAERLKQKGKHYRAIRVAVAHKLLRQAFAIGSQKISYQAPVL